MKLLIKILIFVGLAQSALAQTTPEAAVQAALQSHPTAKAAAFEAQAKKYAEKTALNLPNPEFNVESPTGNRLSFRLSIPVKSRWPRPKPPSPKPASA